jgi:type II secretion system protein C
MNLEDTIREYDWAVRLGLVAVAMVLLALTANRFVAWWLTPMTVPQTREFASKETREQTTDRTNSESDSSSWDDGLTEQCLFGCPDESSEKACPGGCPDGKKCQDGVCVPTEPQKKKPDKPDVPVESDLGIRLMGCMVARAPQYSMALIQDGKSNETYIVSTGDVLPNEAEVVKIKRDRIFLRHQGQLQYVQLQQSISGDPSPVSIQSPGPGAATAPSSSQALERAATSQPESETGGGSGGVERVGENQYVIDGESLEERFDDPGELAQEVRAVPNYDDSGREQRGVKMMGMPPSGIYSEMGFESGDVLRSINGRTVESPEQAREVIETLQSKGSVSVQVERDGRSVEREYQID